MKNRKLTAVFVIYGLLISGLLAYSNSIGWSIIDSAKSGDWGPAGQSMYHK